MKTARPSLLMPDSDPFYTPQEPFNTGRLRVSPLHEIYYEESGNPHGKPVVFLHGGPGGGTAPWQRGFFNPARYRIVLFDQRGCGQSTPHASLEENTTWHLVDDIEKLRTKLDIPRWQVFGGSWGSTLALSYAETHPSVVSELVLRGIFLGRKWELDWLYQRGASIIFPDAWQHFLNAIPEGERDNLVAAYAKRLMGDDREACIAAAKAWSTWEGRTSRLLPDEKSLERYADGVFAQAFARIECHYFVNNCFLGDNQLLANIGKIRHIPTTIVQGRYDMVCPIESAWDLHRAFPEAEFVVVPDAGHSPKDTGLARALIEATDGYAQPIPFLTIDIKRRCVYLDRDGVINMGINVNKWEDMQLIPGIREAIIALKKAGFLIIIVTNQGGLGENLEGGIHWKAHPLSREQLDRIHARMNELLGNEAKPDAIYVCPHSKSIACTCRKPLPGMIDTAAKDHNVDVARSFMVGDRDTDVATGTAAGATGILVLSGPDGDKTKDKDRVPPGTPIFPSLVEAAAWIIAQG